MKTMKKWMVLFLCLTLLLGIAAYFPVTAEAKDRVPLTSGSCGYGVNYSFDSGTGTLTIEGSGPMANYDANSYKSPFSGRDEIVHVKIGDGVTTVGRWAFYDCFGITDVELGKDVKTVFGAAFYGCVAVSSVTLPEGLTTIGESGFNHCIAWQEINLPKSVTSIGKWAFDDTGYYRDKKNWENNVLYFGTFLYAGRFNVGCLDSSYPGPKPYVSDAYESFELASGNISVKEGTKVIVDDAFKYCSKLTGVTIPDSVTRIGKNAFTECGFTSITLPKDITTIEESTFSYCKSLKSVTLPKNMKEIGEKAFCDCESLAKITLPNGLTSIGDEAFAGSGLKSVTIPKSVKKVGKEAFKGCSSLKSVTIKSGVRSVGEEAFYLCSSLKSVTIPKSVKTIGKRAFGYTYNNETVSGFKIRGYKNSAAQKYAKNNKIKFVVVK